MANTSLLVSSPDFFNLKQRLKSFLENQSQFNDYNFDGSNLNVMLDLLAYNSYQDAFLLNMEGSEMFLDTAQLESSIYSKCKELNYLPRSIKSSTAVFTLNITANDSPSYIVVPKNTIFTSTNGNDSYNFVTKESAVLIPTSNTVYSANLTVYEGFVSRDVYLASDSRRYFITSTNVDTDSLNVYVTDNNEVTTYTYAPNLLDVNPQSNVYFLQLNYDGRYEIYFGDDILGTQPATDSTVTIEYRVTNGDLSNGCQTFRLASSVSGYSNYSITTIQSSNYGYPKETLTSIKKFAPLNNTVRSRAITEEDHALLLSQKFPEILDIIAIGGEELDPPRYGKVGICAVTNQGTYLNSIQKQKYYAYLIDRNNPNIDIFFIDPLYLYVNVSTTVSWNYTKTTKTETDIKTDILSSIQTFGTDNLNKFNSSLRVSNLSTIIDETDVSINGSSTTLTLFSIVDTSTLKNLTQSINFFNPLKLNDNGSTSIYSTYFTYNNKSCRFESREDGILYLTYSNNGVNTILSQAGSVDFVNGIVTINPITVLNSGILKLYASPNTQFIKADKNVILNMSVVDVLVNLENI